MRGISHNVSGLAALITIQKGLATIRFSTADRVLIANNEVWAQGPGAKITTLQFPADGSPANADIAVMTEQNGLFRPGDGADGDLDDWPCQIDLVDPNNPAAIYNLLTGIIGSVQEDSRGMLTIAVNGQLTLAQKKPLCEHFTLTGREDLGDDRCKIPILLDPLGTATAYDIQRNQAFQLSTTLPLLHVFDAFGRVKTGTHGDVRDYANVYYECTTAGTTAATAPTYDPTIGNTTTDGSAVFTARDAWTRYAFGAAVDD